MVYRVAKGYATPDTYAVGSLAQRRGRAGAGAGVVDF
jgi:hypothetical protein